MSADKAIVFSAREMEVLALAWQCMEQQPKVRIPLPCHFTVTQYISYIHTDPPQVDMNKLASLTGYTPGSASVTFGNIKRKIKLLGEGLAADGPANPKKTGGPGRGKTGTTPKSTGKRGAAANDDESPTKRAKKSSAKKSRSSDDDEEDIIPKVKKEELVDINEGANGFYNQLQGATYEFEQPEHELN
jgi:hypothetical protein